MKTVQFIIISLVLGIVSATINNIALAQKDVKLVGIEPGANNKHVSVDIIGNTIIVGGHILPHIEKISFSTIFTGDGKNWKRTAELHPRGRDPEDPTGGDFGWSVSLGRTRQRGSAGYAIVGAPAHDGAADKAGGAYIYASSGNDWKQQVKLLASDAAAGDAFGYAVSINGTTAVVGAPKDDDAGSNSGSVYIFVRDGDSWKQQAKLAPQDLGGSAAFGSSVVVLGDTVVVGAPGHSPGGIRFAGAVYIFVHEGKTWRQQTKLTADDAAASDRFGHAVAMSGKSLIVAAPLRDNERGKDAGTAYIFVRDADRWKQQTKLIAKDIDPGNHFGSSVTTNGNIAIIGANLREENALAAGAAYAFARVDGLWEEREKVVPDDAGQNTRFGTWVAMSGDTVVVAAGAAHHNVAGRSTGTAGYVYNSIEDGSYWVSRSWEILRAFYASETCKNPDMVRDSGQPLDELVVWKT